MMKRLQSVQGEIPSKYLACETEEKQMKMYKLSVKHCVNS
jgi:hypothetical protein